MSTTSHSFLSSTQTISPSAGDVLLNFNSIVGVGGKLGSSMSFQNNGVQVSESFDAQISLTLSFDPTAVTVNCKGSIMIRIVNASGETEIGRYMFATNENNTNTYHFVQQYDLNSGDTVRVYINTGGSNSSAYVYNVPSYSYLDIRRA